MVDAKKRTKGATKRRNPLPLKRWFFNALKVAFGFALAGFIWFSGQFIMSISWRPLAITQYEISEPLVYESSEQVEAVLQSYMGQSLLFVDLLLLNRELENLPWIRHASVLKAWPGKLLINFSEHEPVAFWNDIDVLNSDGIPLLHPVADLKLASLHGPNGQSGLVMDHYLQFARIFREQGLVVEEVSMRPRGAWSLKLETGVEIVLGEKDVLERSRRVVDIINSDEFDLNNIVYIDARYPNGVAVKVKEPLLLEVEDGIAA